MTRSRQGKDIRERLLEEGVAAFREHGYHGTGLKQVLDRVKVPKGSFYNYFESKEAFGAATIRYFSERLGEKLRNALTGAPDPLSGLRAFFEQLMTEFEQADFVGGCLIANLGGELEGSELCRRTLVAALRDWRNGVRDAIREAQTLGLARADIDAGELADMLIEAWEGAVIRMKIERSLNPLRQCLHRLLDNYFKPI